MPKSVRWILGGVIAVIILIAIAWQWDWYARTVVIREHPECLTTSQHPEDSAYIPPCAYALVPQTLWQQLFGNSDIVSSAQVPAGWYAHDLIAQFASSTGLLKYDVLTKHADLPQHNAGDAPYDSPQIIVSEMVLSVSPEQKMEEDGLSRDAVDAAKGLPVGRWTAYQGHKMFTITLEQGGDAVMLFGGDLMYEFTFIGDSQDRNDLWKVINFYAEDPSLPVISRAETQANCEDVTLPPGQEYDIMADPETGYVTIGYWPTSGPGIGMEAYAFFNYNDDLSQCTPSVKDVLERTKGHGDAMTQ